MNILKCDCCGKKEELKKDCPCTFLFKELKDIKVDLCFDCENKLEGIISDFLKDKETIWNAVKDVSVNKDGHIR